MFVEIPGQGGSKITFPTRNNGASASSYKGKEKQPRHFENDEENDQNTEKFKVALEGSSGNKDEK